MQSITASTVIPLVCLGSYALVSELLLKHATE